MIKALLFDYGGVIVDDSAGERLSEQLADNLGVSNQSAWDMLGPSWQKFTRGKITEPEIWSDLEKQYGKPIPVSKRNIWNGWDKMPRFPEMISFVKQLKKDGLITGLISTTVPVTAADIRAHGGYDLFDPVILSCEVGYAKPDPEIYTIAMGRLPAIRPEEVIFLDDRRMCLSPAQAIGMQTVLVENAAQAIAATREILSQSARRVYLV